MILPIEVNLLDGTWVRCVKIKEDSERRGDLSEAT